MESKQKQTWRGVKLIQMFVAKVINNERNILTHHEIIDHIAEQIEPMIPQVRKKTKLRIHPNWRRSSLSYSYSFKLACFSILYI